MLTVLRTFIARSDDGLEMMMSECLVENDTTGMHNVAIRSTHIDSYFRQSEGGMHAKRAKQIEPGVFEFDNGLVVREVT